MNIERARRRVLASGFAGSTVEFYDFILYGTASAIVFNRLFFTNLDPVTGTIASFGTLAVGYLARPIGGVIFGHFGDRFGRKRALIVSLVMMGISSTLIGVLPTQPMVGAIAPILLIVLRIVQGLSMAGEWGGATIMAMEHSDAKSRGRYSAIITAGAPLGSLLASGSLALFAMLPGEQFISWGWRVPFLLSAVLLVIALWIRLRVDESPLFLQAKEREVESKSKQRAPAVASLMQWKQLVVTMFAALGPQAHRTLMTAFLISAAFAGGMPRSTVLWISAASGVLNLVLIAPFGRLADVVGRKKLLYVTLAIALVTVWPTFEFASSGNFWLVLIAFVVAGLCGTAVLLPTVGTLIIEQFPTRNRYTGSAIGYQLAASLGGGLAPMIAAVLVTSSGEFLALSIVTMFVLLVSAIAVWALREMARKSIAD